VQKGGLPAAGTEVPGGGPCVPPTAALRKHRRLGVQGGIQGAPGGGQWADGLVGCGRDAVQGTHGELRPLPQPQHRPYRRPYPNDGASGSPLPGVQEP
jgi:hypothetical protein